MIAGVSHPLSIGRFQGISGLLGANLARRERAKRSRPANSGPFESGSTALGELSVCLTVQRSTRKCG
jgi:hypothetical protein